MELEDDHSEELVQQMENEAEKKQIVEMLKRDSQALIALAAASVDFVYGQYDRSTFLYKDQTELVDSSELFRDDELPLLSRVIEIISELIEKVESVDVENAINILSSCKDLIDISEDIKSLEGAVIGRKYLSFKCKDKIKSDRGNDSTRSRATAEIMPNNLDRQIGSSLRNMSKILLSASHLLQLSINSHNKDEIISQQTALMKDHTDILQALMRRVYPKTEE